MFAPKSSKDHSHLAAARSKFSVSPFLRSALSSLVYRFSGLGLQLIVSIALARQLGASGFGSYVYAFTWALLIGTFLDLGMGQLAVRELSRRVEEKDFGAVLGFVRIWLAALFFTCVSATGVIFTAVTLGWAEFGVPWGFIVLIAVTHAAILGLSSMLSGVKRPLLALGLESVARQCLFVAALLLLVSLDSDLDIQMVMSLSLLATLPIIIAMAYHFAKAIGITARSTAPTRVYHLRFWLLASFPFLLLTMTTQLQNSLDTLMLGSMVSMADVGLFRAAARGADLIVISQGVTFQMLGPLLARALLGQDHIKAQALISQGALLSAAFGTLLCTGLIFFPTLYLGLFGEEFKAAATVMVVLVLAQFVSLLCGPVGETLVMLHRERLVLGATVVVLILKIPLQYVFINQWGILGASAATLFAIFVLKAYLLYSVVKAGFDPTPFGPIRKILSKAFRNIRNPTRH
jgi:O-antigen/teichoic acid export membrane protein